MCILSMYIFLVKAYGVNGVKVVGMMPNQSIITYPTHPLADQAATAIQIGSKILTPFEISCKLLHHAKEIAQNQLHEQPTGYVVTMPAHYIFQSSNALSLACATAKMDLIKLELEPVGKC